MISKKLKKLFKYTHRRMVYVIAGLVLILGTFYLATGHGRASTTDTFTTSGTWTVPANVFSADFEAWGGGGAGAGSSSNGTGGGGGAGGQYAIKSAVSVTPGDSYTVTVATTVAGGAGAGATGNDSQVTDPSSTVFIRAKGGAGGTVGGAGGTGSTTNGIGDVPIKSGGSGGAGSGASATAGGGGGGAGSTGNGGDGSGNTAGTGTTTNGGTGGAGGTGNYTGLPGNNYGGGGSGGSKSNASAHNGGGGAQGLVTVTYTVTPPSYNQTSFEFFDNANSTTPGTAHGNNTNFTLSSTGQAFRLRQLLSSNVNVPTSSVSSSTKVDTSSGFTGSSNDIAIGSDGLARLSSIDSSGNNNLDFVQCTNTSCSSENVTVIDTGIGGSSLYMDPTDGFARVSYDNAAILRFAQCTNAACSTKNLNTIDTVSGGITETAIALGSDSFARIAYLSSLSGVVSVKFAQCTNTSCSTHNLTTVDNAGGTDVQVGVSMAIAADGFARIGWEDISAGSLKFIQCTNADCSTKNSTVVIAGVPSSLGNTSVNINPSDGFARISYTNSSNQLKFVQCTNAACTTSNISTVDSSVSVSNISASLGSDGFARIAYNDVTNTAIRYAVCLDTGCASSTIQTLPSSIAAGSGNAVSLALASNNGFRIGYPDNVAQLSYLYPPFQFKLQYGALGGACSSATYSDVTSSSLIAFSDNSTPSDGAAITYQSGTDPTDTGQTVSAQSYHESNSFSNDVSSFGTTVDGEWDFSLKDNGAPATTTYCLRVSDIDGAALSTYTNYPQITTATPTPPASPSLLSPESGATAQSTAPLFQLKSTDASSNYLEYKILLYNSDCSTGLQTFDQTSSQKGWLQQDQQNSTAYTSSTSLGGSSTAFFGGASLSANTTYCWKAASIDPGGTNTFSSFSATQLFTTGNTTSGDVKIQGGGTIRGGTIIR